MKIKKIIILSIFFCSYAFCENYFSEFRFEDRSGKNNHDDSEIYGVSIGNYVSSNIELDIFTREKYPHTGNNNTRVELGVKYKLPLSNSLTYFSRIAAGKKYLADNNYSYWNFENGFKLNIYNALDGIVSLRYRDSFNKDKWQEFDRTYKLGLIYKLTNSYFLSTTYNHARGESAFDSVGLNFKINF